MGNWKEQLGQLKPTLPKGEPMPPKKPEGKEAPRELKRVPTPQEERMEIQRANEEARKRKMDEVEKSDDFQMLIKALGLHKGNKKTQNKYYGLLREMAASTFGEPVAHGPIWGIRHYIYSGDLEKSGVRELVGKYEKQELINQAYRFWQTAQPEGMRYGTSSHEERLRKAEEMAKKAGMALDEIVKMKNG